MNAAAKKNAVRRPSSAAWAAALCVVLALGGAMPPDTAHAAIENATSGVRFRYGGGGDKVFLAGDWNGWSTTATPMVKVGAAFEVIVPGLTAGDHMYKFVVDGNWMADPDNPRTGGDFGNSLLTIGADGKLPGTSTAATAAVGGGTADVFTKAMSSVNPKVQIDGRYVATYTGVLDRAHSEWNVTKPGHNLDVAFNVQMNSNMTARMLTNINGTHENSEPWRVHANFDRGRMDLHMPTWALTSFDNDAPVTAGDSLHTFGDVGIYRYAFGYNNSGLHVTGSGPQRSNWWLLYTDRNADGTRPFPVANSVALEAETDTAAYGADAVSFLSYQPGSGTRNENTAGAGFTVPVTKSLAWSASYRNARGANLADITVPAPGSGLAPVAVGGLVSAVALANGDIADLRIYSTVEGRTLAATTFTWTGYGRAAWLAGGISETHAAARQVYIYPVRLGVSDLTSTLTPDAIQTSAKTWNLSRSYRVQAGMHGRLAGTRYGVLGGTVEHERHRYSTAAFGGLQIAGPAGEDTLLIETPLTTHRTTLTGEISAPLGRWTLGLKVRDEIFKYDEGTPWGAQLWFSGGNAWLDEHVLTIPRYTLLGGRAAVLAEPRVRVTAGRGDRWALDYRGTIATAGLQYKPSFVETRTLLSWKATDRITLVNDNRCAHYNSTQLGLKHTYWSNFAEARYNWTQQISIELGVGVDPDVLDPVPNEYRDIGRDLYLFNQGASETAARTNYRRFGTTLDAAERALSRERRVQLEAKLAF